MTKVVVVTRTKDRLGMLQRALVSVKDQTFDDYVQVVFNNGGDKGSVEDVAHGFERVRVIYSDRLLPRGAALNRVISEADAEYVAILDDDDTWHPDFLKRVVEHLEGTGANGVVVRIDKVIERVGADGITTIGAEPWMTDLKVVSLYQQCIDNQLASVGFVYRKTAYEEIGGYDETLNILEDYEFGLRFLMKYDVDFLDPGFALANYHHRKVRKGEMADNSFARDDHRQNFYKIANRHLRQELAEGRLGVGYIMSKLKYDQSYMARVAKRVMPKSVANALKRRIQD